MFQRLARKSIVFLISVMLLTGQVIASVPAGCVCGAEHIAVEEQTESCCSSQSKHEVNESCCCGKQRDEQAECGCNCSDSDSQEESLPISETRTCKQTFAASSIEWRSSRLCLSRTSRQILLSDLDVASERSAQVLFSVWQT